MSNLKNLSELYKANKLELGYIDVYEKYFENFRLSKILKGNFCFVKMKILNGIEIR